MYFHEDLAYGGEPVEKYNGEIPYNFNIHECLPEHEVNMPHHKKNFNFHGKKLSQPLLAELDKYTAQDDELKNFYNNFAKKRIFPKPGAIRYGLIGPTGAGKSTLINTLNSVGSLSTEVSILDFCSSLIITNNVDSLPHREVRHRSLSFLPMPYRRTSRSLSPSFTK